MRIMKYLASAVLCATAFFSLAGCGDRNKAEQGKQEAGEKKEEQSILAQEQGVIDADFQLERVWGDLYLSYEDGIQAKNASDELVFQMEGEWEAMDDSRQGDAGYGIQNLPRATGAGMKYVPVTDQLILDRQGKEVFSLEDSDYDVICYTGCLDAGYILCAKREESESGEEWQYAAVSLPDGRTRLLDGTDRNTPGCNRAGEGSWYYCGNGYFFRYQGRDQSLHLFDLSTSGYYDAYMEEDGEMSFTGFPDTEYWEYDSSEYGILNYQTENQIYHLDLVSGFVDREDWQSEMLGRHLDGYTNIVLKYSYGDGSKLICMQDKDGNAFVNLLDGSFYPLFDQLPGVDAKAINQKSFLLYNQDGEYWICNLSGKPKIRVAEKRFLAGRKTILFWDDKQIYHLFDPENDRVLDLEANMLPENAVCNSFGVDGTYVFTTPSGEQTTLLAEDGTITWLHRE